MDEDVVYGVFFLLPSYKDTFEKKIFHTPQIPWSQGHGITTSVPLHLQGMFNKD